MITTRYSPRLLPFYRNSTVFSTINFIFFQYNTFGAHFNVVKSSAQEEEPEVT